MKVDVDPREAFDWAEYEAYLDGELQAHEMERANLELLEVAAEQEIHSELHPSHRFSAATVRCVKCDIRPWWGIAKQPCE